MRFDAKLCLAAVVGLAACAGPTSDPAASHDDAITLGGRLPGEFEPVDTLLVTWSDGVDAEWKAFGEDVVRAVSPRTRVLVVVGTDGTPNAGPSLVAEARDELARAGASMANVSFFATKLDTNWIRDYGPEVVRGPFGVRWAVDSDCCTEAGRPADEQAGATIARDALHVFATSTPLAIQGGNLEADGRGRCITTDTAVSDDGGDEADVVAKLRAAYGCVDTVVLPALDGEPNGHVDMLAMITGPAEVIVGRASPAEDGVNAGRLDRAATLLAQHGFAVRRVPMPARTADASAALGGKIFPSYTNAVAVNDVVLVPVFAQDRTHEAEALDVFRRAFPERTIVPIESAALIAYGGAVHCATKTIPR